ncbi:hypothetical protein ACH9EU_05460 [Kocuria sp. M1R5S2]|uniref:S-layer homology domain-containing protein n=1 Tax=Kocuria rhizosphaerae TaxID=3376285 RepID=UPI0037A8BC4C
MSEEIRTTSSTRVSRRHLIGATALLGSSAAVASTAVGARPAAAAVVLGQEVKTSALGIAGTVTGRHRDLFRSYTLTSASGVGVITVGTARYLVTFNAGDGTKALQIFNADTGAVHYAVDTPGKTSGNWGHDGEGNIYFSSGRNLMAVSVPNRSIRQFGTAAADIAELYEFQVDYKGRLWAGTFPAGVVVCLDPSTGAELTRTPALGNGNEYARGLSISPDRKIVWSGTGTADPDLFRIDVDAPSSPARRTIPGRGLKSFVPKTVALGRKVFVWHNNTSGSEVVSVHDVVSGTWSDNPVKMSSRSITELDADGYAYVNNYGVIRRIRPLDADMVVETVAPVDDRYTVHIGLIASTLYLVSKGSSVLSAARVSTAGSTGRSVQYQVVPVPLATQSMVIDRATNTAYAGGYRGDGLCSTNLATGVFAHSAPSAEIEQIEGMAVDGGTLFVGSYPKAVVVTHSIAKGVQDSSAFATRASLSETHQQSRIFAWASAQSHVVFGTVPDYGLRGGALGTYERATGTVKVYNKLIPELSIVGLTAEGHTVYGGTSVRGGMGSTDWTGDAVAFAADARTGALKWKRTLPGTKELYGPVLLNGKLYVATLDTVVELRLSDGAPLRTFVIGNRTGRAAWQSVELAVVPGTTRLAHMSWGTLTILSTATGQYSRVLTGTDRHLDFDGGGSLWVTTGTDIVKLVLDNANEDGAPYTAPATSPFVDITPSTTFYKEMAWMADAGISGGWSTAAGKEYRPRLAVDRDVMAAFLYRLAGSPPYTAPATSPFVDITPSTTFYKEMAWMADRGISGGWSTAAGKEYRPRLAVDRGVMAAFLYRLAGSPPYTAPSTSPFVDVTPTSTFYREMAWMADRGISGGWSTSEGKEYRPRVAVDRGVMAAFLYRLSAGSL